MSTPRAKTAEEVQQEFLEYLHSISVYWANESNRTVQEKCDGLVFSILNIFDGTTVALPAMNISLAPHPDDREYHEQEGENWYEPDMVVNDCMLHELWSASETQTVGPLFSPKPHDWELDLLNKIADKLNLPAGADLEGILPLLDEKLK